MNNTAPKSPPSYWAAIVEFDRLASRLEMLRELKQIDQELKRRSTQSPHAFLRLQAGE